MVLYNELDVRGSVHHRTIHKENPNKIRQCIKICIILYSYEVQHVSGDTTPIIRSLKLQWQPLLFIRRRLLDVYLVDVVRQIHCLTKSTN